MLNSISLTNFLIDLRTHNYTIYSPAEITDKLQDRGFETSTLEIREMLRNLERLSYVKRAATNSGYRMVNATQSISFTGCVWCGAAATPNYEERKVTFGTKSGYQETKLVATNTDRICKSCSVSEEFVEDNFDQK